jgi:hypothetical protein
MVEASEAALKASRFSSTSTRTPASARLSAATSPTGPAPATITSASKGNLDPPLYCASADISLT